MRAPWLASRAGGRARLDLRPGRWAMMVMPHLSLDLTEDEIELRSMELATKS